MSFGSNAICHFSGKSDCKKEKSMVLFMHEQNIICSQTQLHDVVHEQTIIGRQLFAGLWLNEKEEKFSSNDKHVY